MLYVLTSSLATTIRDKAQRRHDVVSAVEHIAQSRREGKHLVFANRDTLTILKDSPVLSLTARRVYAKLLYRLPQDKSYYDRLTWRVEVVEHPGILRLVMDGKINTIVMSAKFLEDFSLVDETIVLSENQTDVEFYKLLADATMSRNRLGQVVIKCDARGGGGQTTAKEYANIQKRKNRLCLCVLDGDYKYPGCTMGETARSVQRIDDPMQPLCFALFLQVREIENLVPISLYLRVSANDPLRTRTTSILEQIVRSRYPEARGFFDMKKGLRISDLSLISPETPYYKFWATILSELGIPLICTASAPCRKREECSCIAIAGFGSNILQTVISYLQSLTYNDLNLLLDENAWQEWENLGGNVIAWCCGANKLRTT